MLILNIDFFLVGFVVDDLEVLDEDHFFAAG
jgi:hypothetical protein